MVLVVLQGGEMDNERTARQRPGNNSLREIVALQAEFSLLMLPNEEP